MSAKAEYLHRLRVALVEDDEQVLRSLQMLLRARGFAVDTYRSGLELLSNHASLQVDCMLIDYKMPRLDGLELIQKLRDLGNTTPALMITGYFSSTLKNRAVNAGFADVIEKTSNPQSLLEKIHFTLDRP
jgi:FixJ family two-component response regulator